MKKKSVLIVAAVLTFVLAASMLIACGKAKPSIVGEWEYENADGVRGGYAYKFNEDGTGTYSFVGESKDFTYENDDKTITINMEGYDTQKIDYTLDGDKLILHPSADQEVIYYKK